MADDEKKKRVSRRGKGEGSVGQRTDGLWVARITIGRNASGKRIRKAIYGKTKKAVTDKLTKLASFNLDGLLVDTGSMTVGDLLTRWLHDSARLSVAPTTYDRYRLLVEKHVAPQLGGIKLSLLRAIHIQSMLSRMEQLGTGAETRRYSFQVLRRALNVGERWGLIIRNPCNGVDRPKVVRRDIRPLNAEETRTLLSHSVGNRYEALIVLALTTGMRQGELFGLQWEDVDLNNERLFVCHTLEEVRGRLRLKEPKSKSGKRQIKIPGMAVEALAEHRAKLLAEGLAACPMVFPDADGGFLRKSNFERRVWKPLRKAAGISSDVTFHDLRHTSASLLLTTGTHPKVVQERLGHSKISLTMDTYSHLLPGMQDQAASSLNDLLKAQRADRA